MTWTTHEVRNQVPDLENYNLYSTDPILRAGLQRGGGMWREPELLAQGARLGSADGMRLGELADQHRPELKTHDRAGRRIDQVEFHPAWHSLLEMVRSDGLVSLPFSDPRPGAWSAYAAGMYLHGQIDAGSLCPTTMTMAAIPLLKNEPALFAQLGPKLYSRDYDARDVPLADKKSIQIGMGMTEKQGGSDLRANITTATPIRGEGRGAEYSIVGHKWFFSAPMCDAHLVLARTDGGLSCFYVPRWKPDGEKNPIFIQRLKDKLGNRSNSSSEVEFCGAWGILIGPEGRGIPTIIEMATYSRLACVIGSAAIMRQAIVQALHHARHREAFGRLLIDQPLMRNVLADLALESEAATTLMMRLAAAFENVDDARQRGWCRIVMPAAKFWVCKRAVELTGEAMEVFGGNGYVETGPMARLYREAPVNSIWEGSGNVMCLDVLRAISREPQAAQALFAELAERCRGDSRLDGALQSLSAQLGQAHEILEAGARRFVQDLVLLVQAGLLRSHAPASVSEAFIGGRLSGKNGLVFGSLPADVDAGALLERVWV